MTTITAEFETTTVTELDRKRMLRFVALTSASFTALIAIVALLLAVAA
jgi:hypothetical protein